MDFSKYVPQVIELMGHYHIQIRDSYKKDRVGAFPSGFEWELAEDKTSEGVPTAESSTAWKSLGYSAYKIRIAKRLEPPQKHHGALAHEIVHFLQHTTPELERGYIRAKYDANRALLNADDYLGQRSEAEAHLIHFAYQVAHQKEAFPLLESSVVMLNVRSALDAAMKNRDDQSTKHAIIFARNLQII